MMGWSLQEDSQGPMATYPGDPSAQFIKETRKGKERVSWTQAMGKRILDLYFYPEGRWEATENF